MADVTLVLKAQNSDLINKVKDAQRETQKLYDTADKGMQREKGLIEDVEDTLKQYQEAKRKAYSIEDIEKYNKKIEEAKKDLEEYEKAGQKVEKQTESMTQAIGKWVGSLGLVTVVLNKLKEAFMQTVQGIDLMNIAGAALNQMLGNIVSGTANWNKGVAEAIALAKQENAIRKQSYIESVKAKKLMQEYNKLRTEGIDATIKSEEKIKKLTAAKEKFTEAINIEITNTKAQLDIAYKQWKLQPENEKRQEKYFGLLGRVLDLQGEIESGTRTLIAQITAEEEKAAKDLIEWRKNLHNDLNKLVEDYLAEQGKIKQDALQKEITDQLKGEKEWSEKYDNHLKLQSEQKKEWALADGNLLKYITQQTADAQKEIGKGLDEADKKIEEDKIKRVEDAEAKKRALRKQTWDTIIEGEQAIFDILSNNINNRLNEEMIALDKETQGKIKRAGDDEKKILEIQEAADKQALEIEKKYKRQQQKIAIAQTIINGAQAIVKTFADYGFTPAAWVANALLAALTALQIGVIKSQKFAKGGWTGKGGMTDETGERIAGIVHEDEFVTRKGPAKKYREVLEAINKDDQRLALNRFTKFMPETIIAPVNNVSVENTGPNTRLDRINNQLYNLNRIMQPKRQTTTETMMTGTATVIRRGTSVRTIKR